MSAVNTHSARTANTKKDQSLNAKQFAKAVKECQLLPKRNDTIARLQGALELTILGVGGVLSAVILFIVCFAIWGEALSLNKFFAAAVGTLFFGGLAALIRAMMVVMRELGIEPFFELIVEHLFLLEHPVPVIEHYVLPSQRDEFKSLINNQAPFIPMPMNCEYAFGFHGDDDDRTTRCDVRVYAVKHVDGEKKCSLRSQISLTAIQSDNRDWYLVLPSSRNSDIALPQGKQCTESSNSDQ